MALDMPILVWVFFLLVVGVRAGYSDFDCLKSIKESLEDPENVLSSTWRFDEGAVCNKFNGVECWSSGENKVSSIRLSGMGLVGSFPRGLGNCTSLIALDLSHNNLSGPLPSDISTLIGFIVDLDLSNNDFSGEIPTSISQCAYVNRIILDNNEFEGRIPPELSGLSRLQVFSVANNHLSGPVPDLTEVRNIYSNNSGLCGGPLPPCIEENNNDSTIKFVGGFIVGWVVSALVTLYLGLFYLPNMSSSCQRRP